MRVHHNLVVVVHLHYHHPHQQQHITIIIGHHLDSSVNEIKGAFESFDCLQI